MKTFLKGMTGVVVCWTLVGLIILKPVLLLFFLVGALMLGISISAFMAALDMWDDLS